MSSASKSSARSVLARARRIRLLLVDVDGVMTDGHIHLQSFPDGDTAELKVFHAHDGAGLKMAHAMGLRTGLITGRESPATARRAREAQMDFVYQHRDQKLEAYEEILRQAGLVDAEVAYVGDDLPDLPLMTRAGLAVAIANAAPEVKKTAHYVTRRKGGEGAVREVVELLLKAQRRWHEAIGQARA